MKNARRPRHDPWTRDCVVSDVSLALANERWRRSALRSMRRTNFRALLVGSIKSELGFADADAENYAEGVMLFWSQGGGAVEETVRTASRAALAEPRPSSHRRLREHPGRSDATGKSCVVASVSTPRGRQ